MSTTGLRRCCHCRTWFKPHPRNAYHQRFCMKPHCQAESRRVSRQKWCRKNPGYFRGEHHVKRVQDWRRAHPGYWKRRGTKGGPTPAVALQDLFPSQPVDEKLVTVLRNRLSEEISRPLQDVLIAHQHALVGITSMITGDALQDDIARVLASCYERGQRIGGIVPWMQRQEVTNEGERTDCAAATPAHPTPVQLGGSPSGP